MISGTMVTGLKITVAPTFIQLLRLALARGNDPQFAAPKAAVLPLSEASMVSVERFELP